MLIMTHSSVSTIVTFLLSCRVTILSLSDTRAINILCKHGKEGIKYYLQRQ